MSYPDYWREKTDDVGYKNVTRKHMSYPDYLERENRRCGLQKCNP